MLFDPLKLRAINAAYIRALPAEEFRRLADPFIDSAVHCSIDRDLLCGSKIAGDLEMRAGSQILIISSREKISCSPSGAQPSSSR